MYGNAKLITILKTIENSSLKKNKFGGLLKPTCKALMTNQWSRIENRKTVEKSNKTMVIMLVWHWCKGRYTDN